TVISAGRSLTSAGSGLTRPRRCRRLPGCERPDGGPGPGGALLTGGSVAWGYPRPRWPQGPDGPEPPGPAVTVARAPKRAQVPAARLPIARVSVDVPLPHLDRLFDYLVPESMADAAVPGCRIRVRFAGRLTGGYLVERAEATEHQGKLAFLSRV